MRVVSLVPSVSETLVAWGLVPVAVTRFCEQPGLPTVGGTKSPDVDAIAALRPDVVVMDRQENRREDADALAAAGLVVHATDVRALEDVGPTLDALRAAVGLAAAGEEGKGDSSGPDRRGGVEPIRVWVPVWRRPWMTVNHATYGSSLLAACGAINVFADHPDTYPTVEFDEVAGRRPDVVLAPSEPYPWSERHRSLLEAVAPMVLVDGRDLWWWGTRTPAARARLSALLAGLAAGRPA
ncbi:MAG TPA: helical backbone metal receptor [Acidimicrobiales bacterium]|nr:helical backbone metal receptor [Acidimicrobiales bacterium]